MFFRNLRPYLFATVLSLFSFGAWGIPTLQANPDTTAPNLGDTINVALDLTGIPSGGPGLVVMHFDFYYDTTKLNLVSATAGDFFSANPGSIWADFSTFGLSEGDSVDTSITDSTTTPDVLGFDFTEFNFTPSVNNGTLVNLQFTALSIGSAGLNFNDVLLIDDAFGFYSNTDVTDVIVTTVSVTEPTTLPLIALGLLLVLLHRRLNPAHRSCLPLLQPQCPSRFG